MQFPFAVEAEITMVHATKFWDRRAAGYAKRPIGDEDAYRKKLQITREYLKPDMEVLELGCGTGSTAIAHAAYVKHIQATDISSKMLEIARRKAVAANVENVTFEQSSFDEFAAPDQSFDAVLALNVLHLLEDREEVISRVHRLLKPGGVFVSNTACLANSMNIFRVIAPVGKFFGLLPSVKVFTTHELVESLTGAGFEIAHQSEPAKAMAVFIVARRAG
jgi:ubiquinone/menaquinone biosynthesis C-methylase UbiE